MQDEPRYVEDPFEENTWREPANEFEEEILEACGRKYFKSPAQAKKIHRLLTVTSGHRRKYPDEYIKYLLNNWVRKENRYRPIISLDAFISGVRNVDNLARWQREHPSDEDRRSRYANVP